MARENSNMSIGSVMSYFLGIAFLLLAYTLTAALAGCGYKSRQSERAAGEPVLKQAGQAGKDEKRDHAESTDVADVPQLVDAAFYGDDFAWVVPALGKHVYYTDDSGSEWNHIPTDFIDFNGRISFIDPLHGWVLSGNEGTGQVWQTNDGGNTWTAISKLKDTDGEWEFTSAVQIKFTDKRHGWILETFSVWHTEDGGRNWKRTGLFSNTSEQNQPTQGFFLDASKAWICGTNGKVYITSDGGRTWNTKNVDNSSEFSNISFVNEHTGFLNSSLNGKLYRTDDGGDSWRLLPELGKGTHLESIHFINDRIGWAAGRIVRHRPEEGSTKGVVLYTNDGGLNWQFVQVDDQESYFNYVYFTDIQNGWLFARNCIYHTRDEGKSWQRRFVLPGKN